MRYYWTVSEPRWRLPVTVERQEGTDIMAVRLTDLPMLPKQRQVLIDRLNLTSLNSDENVWYFMHSQFKKIAAPFMGTDIQDAVEWTPSQGKVESRVQARVRIDELEKTESFLRPLVGSGFFGSYEAADMMWSIFKVRMKDHLINDGGVIPLGFARICALPYRANWKQVLFQYDLPRFHMSSVTEPWRDRAMDLRGTKFAMRDERLTSWNAEDKRLNWTLEIIPTKDWHSLVHRLEDAKAKTQTYYRVTIADSIRRMIPLATEVYADYLERIASPTAVLTTFKRDIRGRITGATNRARAKAGRAPVPLGEPITLGEESVQGGSGGETGELRGVFCFPPPNATLRPPGELMEEPEDASLRSPGMPVPDG